MITETTEDESSIKDFFYKMIEMAKSSDENFERNWENAHIVLGRIFTEEQIKISLCLIFFISLFNDLTYSSLKKNFNPFFNISVNIRKGYTALFQVKSSKEKRSQGYFVYPGNAMDLLDYKLLIFDKNGNIKKNGMCISIEEAILGVAFHEVRHSLQLNGFVKMFTPKTKVVNKEICRYTSLYRQLFKEKKGEYVKQKRSWKFIKQNTSKNEFDAYLTQNLFLSDLFEKKVISSKIIRDALFLEPARLFKK